ncbi:MAG: hypothetical protein AAF485_13585 [Chloroflexota bacterium]
MTAIQTRKVQTVEDREAAFNLRYRAYVLERGVPQKHADHRLQHIQEPQDPPEGEGSLDTGIIFGAFSGNQLLGSLRINRVEAFGSDYQHLLGLDQFGLKKEHNACVITKLCIEPNRRGSRAFLKLFLAYFEYTLRAGVMISFADCNAPLYPLFTRLGALQALPNTHHHEYGLVHPLYMIMNDIDHFKVMKSPALRFQDLMTANYETVTYFQDVIRSIKSNTELEPNFIAA